MSSKHASELASDLAKCRASWNSLTFEARFGMKSPGFVKATIAMSSSCFSPFSHSESTLFSPFLSFTKDVHI
jgi:hypothetical protein